MAVETELKLRIAPEHMARLKRHPFLKALAAAPATSRRLHNVYYDTPDLDLQNHAMALRLRRVGRTWVQTLKGGGGVEAGLHSRNEWETPVAGAALDFAALDACGGILPPGAQQKLRPVFATDFTRSVRQLNYQGASIELCMDCGEIRAGTRTRPISELELELKSGAPEQLFRLALALLDIVPLEVEHASKAEYGYGLYRGKPGSGVAPLPELKKSQSVASALRVILSACLLQVQANLPGSLWQPEGGWRDALHAGLRRLDTMLEVAAAWRQDAELASLREQVGTLCLELARVHEWEAGAADVLPRICAESRGHPGLSEILLASARASHRHEAKALARLASPDLPRLILHAGLWMQGGHWQTGAGGESLPDFAKRILQGYSEPVRRENAKADAVRLEALRAACQKLCDSAEIFGSLFGPDKTGPYLAAVLELRHKLGRVCDLAAVRRLLEGMEKEEPGETRTLIGTWLEREQAHLRGELEKAWGHYAAQASFWN